MNNYKQGPIDNKRKFSQAAGSIKKVPVINNFVKTRNNANFSQPKMSNAAVDNKLNIKCNFSNISSIAPPKIGTTRNS